MWVHAVCYGMPNSSTFLAGQCKRNIKEGIDVVWCNANSMQRQLVKDLLDASHGKGQASNSGLFWPTLTKRPHIWEGKWGITFLEAFGATPSSSRIKPPVPISARTGFGNGKQGKSHPVTRRMRETPQNGGKNFALGVSLT